MATGGRDLSVDSRVVCSVCLEPYRGRQPKLLPCFHTFCLPCLTQLAHKDEQANFYVEDDSQQDSARPLPCDLCDENQVSTSYCSKCNNRSCSRCVRTHDKICRSLSAKYARNQTDDSDDDLTKKMRKQLSVVEKVLTRLGEEEGEMEQERRAVEDSINVRYAAGLRVMADARDECLVGLRGAVHSTQDSLQGEITAARTVQARLSRLLRPGGSTRQPATTAQLQASLLKDTDFQQLENQLAGGGRTGFFQHTTDEDTMEAVRNFMGKVTTRIQTSTQINMNTANEAVEGEKTGKSQHSGDSHRKTNTQRESQNGEAGVEVGELYREITTLRKKYTECENLSTSSRRQLTAALERNSTKFSSELATFSREHASLKDKCTLLCQDVASLQAENSKLRGDLTAIATDYATLRQDFASVQADNDTLKTDATKTTTDTSAAQKSLGDLQQTVTDLRKDATKMSTDIGTMRKDVGSLDRRVTSVQAECGKYLSIQDDQSKLHKEVKSLQQKLTTLDISRKTENKKLTRLEAQMATAKTMVSFHAALSRDVRTDSDRTLVLSNVISNTGRGYDRKTGIFTAPVPGIYIFMATSTPSDSDTCSHLKICLDDKNVASSYNKHYESSNACTAALQIAAGQKVWLSSDTYDGSCSFQGSTNSVFCGVLVQPEIPS